MSRLILYDTSNYENFPIGGQLTSVQNFLRYMSDKQSAHLERVLLVGVTNQPDEVGKICKARVDGVDFAFLPVIYRSENLSDVQSSMRVAFLKGLLRHRKVLAPAKGDCHYIQTPEAFLAVKLLKPSAKTVVFSHGNYFDMPQGFRFYQGNRLVKRMYNRFIKLLLRRASVTFVLDESTRAAYAQITSKLQKVANSISLPGFDRPADRSGPCKLVFVGRLSKVKNVPPIIDALSLLPADVSLTILGDGEEKENLQAHLQNAPAQDRILLAGGVSPEQVKQFLRESDILVMNSLFEGVPMAILEAFSYGLPVVSTDVGGIGEVVRFGVDAEKTDGSPQSIANAVLKIRASLADYSGAAYEAAGEYDYRKANQPVFETLNRFLNWKTAPRQGDSER